MKGAERDSVTLLGVKGGPAIRPGTMMPTSTLVRMGGMVILVDAGLGVSAALCRAGVDLTGLDAIFVTHLHSDHYLELGPLLHTAWTAGLRRPVPVYGPAGLAAYREGFLASMKEDIDLRIADEGRPDFAPLFALHGLDESLDTRIGGAHVRALRNHHPPIVDSFALRLEGAGHAVVLSGDTAPMDAMAKFAHAADLLVHEAMLSGGVRALADRLGYDDDRLLNHILRSHTPAEEAARIAARAGARALALNHLIPNDDAQVTEADWRAAASAHFDGPLHIGHDGMEITL